MLTAYHTSQLKEVINIITSAVPAEKIFLLAAQTSHHCYENIFSLKEPPVQEVNHYHLLVLLANTSNRSHDVWQEIIETRCHQVTPVTARVVTVSSFNQWLESVQPFACNVYSKGLLCFDAGTIPLSEPHDINNQPALEKIYRECELYMLRSAEFLSGAGLYGIRKQYKLAAFLLHQSAEQAYIAINWRVSGYRPNTHSLDRLHRYAIPFASLLGGIFPRNTEKEEKLFRLLQKAYIDTRYASDYIIEEGDFNCLAERISRLHEVARQFCMEMARAA
jgi:HEPN domain-containing protein